MILNLPINVSDQTSFSGDRFSVDRHTLITCFTKSREMILEKWPHIFHFMNT